MHAHLHTTAEVEFQIAVCDKRGRTLRQYPKRKNLILNQGLDAIGADPTNQLWEYQLRALCLGTGNLITRRASGATTITANAAGTLTASAGFFEAGDVGRILKLNTGNEYTITGFTNGTTATTSNLTAAAASPGTIHYVNRTGLVNEVSRTSSFTVSSNWDAGTQRMIYSNTILGPVLTSATTYTELGWAAPVTNVFGLSPISPSISLGPGQRLRVDISMSVSPGPIAPIAVNTGLAVGQFALQYVGPRVGMPFFTTNRQVGLSTNSSPLLSSPAFGEDGVAWQMLGGAGFSPYSNGTYFRDGSFSFADTAGAITARRLGLFFGGEGSVNQSSSYHLLLDSPLVKTSNDRIDGTVRLSWGRVLVN